MKRIGVVGGQSVSAEKADLAKRFRRAATSAEQVAWAILRGRRCLGLKFRRQQVIRGFIVDFYCAQHRLVVEIDGGMHDGQVEEDTRRDEALSEIDIQVLRIRNDDVSAETLRVKIEEAIN